MKRCTKCRALKFLDEFNRDRSTKDGRSPWCGVCEREYAKQHYEENRDRLLAEDRDRWANRTEEEKEQYRAKERAYYHAKKAPQSEQSPPRVLVVEAPTDPLAILENAARRMEEARRAG